MDEFQKSSLDMGQNLNKQEITSSVIEVEGNEELDSMREEANQASLINDPPNFNSNSKEEYDKSSSNDKDGQILPEDLEFSVVADKSTSIHRRESSEEIQKIQTNLKSYDSVVRPSNSFNFEPDLNFKTKSLSLFDKMNFNDLGKSPAILNHGLGSNSKKNNILNQISSLRQLEIIKKPLTLDSLTHTQNINHININFNHYNLGINAVKELQSPQENKFLPKSGFSNKLMSVYNELSSKPSEINKKFSFGQDKNPHSKDTEFYQDQFDKFYSNFKSKKKDGVRSTLTYGINSGCSSSLDFKKNSVIDSQNIKSKLSYQHQPLEKISNRVNETFKNQAELTKSKFKDNPKFNKFEMLMSTDFKNARQDQFMLKDEMVDLDEEIMKFRNRHINNKSQEQSSIQEESQINFEDNEPNEAVSNEDDWNRIISRNNEFSPQKGEK